MTPEGGAAAAVPLRTGDVLLLRARGPLAALTAWFGDSRFDHAALVGRAGYLIETGPGGVIERALAERLADPDLLEAQARRLQVGERPLQDPDRIAVLAHALSLRRPAFSGDPLAALGRAAALRDRDLPDSAPLRAVLREALLHDADAAAAVPADAQASAEELEQAQAQARQRLGLMERGNGLLARGGPRQPNPKCVRLGELEQSPSLPALATLREPVAL